MKYLTLIIFVFLSFNAKAETWSCAYVVEGQPQLETFVRLDNSYFRQDNIPGMPAGVLFNSRESEASSWLILQNTIMNGNAFNVQIKAIDKNTGTFIRTHMTHSNSFTDNGFCHMIP